MSEKKDRIRNFCIIAHIDHGKSTLADRFLQKLHLVEDRNFQDQMLDNMDIERERGITIKSQAVTLAYKAKDGRDYILNLVDTPGHVDFSYEVSRQSPPVRGLSSSLTPHRGWRPRLLPICIWRSNTIWRSSRSSTRSTSRAPMWRWSNIRLIMISGSTHRPLCLFLEDGYGVDDLFEAIVRLIPPPKGDSSAPLQALIFDSHYDPYRGVVVHVRVFEGTLREGQAIRFLSSGGVYRIEETGIFKLSLAKNAGIEAGEVGYFIANIKTISDIRVGDTVTDDQRPCAAPLTGFKEVKPVVFSSIYPIDADDYDELLISLEKLTLNDASLVYEKDSSAPLGSVSVAASSDSCIWKLFKKGSSGSLGSRSCSHLPQ
jgi:GTP-binding protein LepA